MRPCKVHGVSHLPHLTCTVNDNSLKSPVDSLLGVTEKSHVGKKHQSPIVSSAIQSLYDTIHRLDVDPITRLQIQALGGRGLSVSSAKWAHNLPTNSPQNPNSDPRNHFGNTRIAIPHFSKAIGDFLGLRNWLRHLQHFPRLAKIEVGTNGRLQTSA
jgi:hypothetical protein